MTTLTLPKPDIAEATLAGFFDAELARVRAEITAAQATFDAFGVDADFTVADFGTVEEFDRCILAAWDLSQLVDDAELIGRFLADDRG